MELQQFFRYPFKGADNFPETFSGKTGIFIGTIYCCFNYDNQRIELYEGSTLKGSYATSFSKTSAAAFDRIQAFTL